MRQSRAAPSTLSPSACSFPAGSPPSIGESGVEAREGDLLFLDMKQALDLTLAADESDAADVTLWIPRRKLLAAVSRGDALHGYVVAGASPAGL